MSEYFSLLDNIKKKFIQLNESDYEKILSLLGLIWDNFKTHLIIKESEDNIYENQIDGLIDFYNPKKNPATRIKIIESLPSMSKILADEIIDKKQLLDLLQVSILYIVKRVNKEYLLLTPEGLIFYFALLDSRKYDDIYRLNTKLIQNYEKYFLNKLREFIFEKFRLLQTKKEGVVLDFKDMGILLFFLVNGSIDEEKAFTREDIRSERALNCVVHSFHVNKELTEEERINYRIRVLQSDVSLLQNKIGYVVHNKESTYFLKSIDLPYIYTILKETIKVKNKKQLISRWKSFQKEYNYWRPILRQNNICFYDRFEVEKMEKEILNIL